MKKTIVTKWVTSVLLAITISPASSAGVFAKLDGIEGEADAVGYHGWSDIISFEQGLKMPVASADTTTTHNPFGGKPKPSLEAKWSDVIVVKQLDKSSHKIAVAVASGRVIPRVILDVTVPMEDGSELAYCRYILKNVQVTSYNVVATNENMLPVENISLNFEEVKVAYRSFGSEEITTTNSLGPASKLNREGANNFSSGWDLVNNQPK